MENYELGRSSWRSLSEGNEKEWLLTNGIGGFANGTITGNTTRIHGGYLIASLNPPIERYTILSKIQEKVVWDNAEADFACQQYLGEEKQGQHYLNHFTYDITPTFHYGISDFTLKKTIAMEYGKNTTVVCYDIKNGKKPCTLYLTPLFAMRDMNKVNEKNNLCLDIEQKGQILEITDKKMPNIPALFYTSKGEYYDRKKIPVSMAAPNYEIEENQYYAIDNRNGFMGLDHHATPYDVIIRLKPEEEKKFYILCTTENNISKKSGFELAQEYKERVWHQMGLAKVQNEFARKLSWAADQFIVKRKSTGLKTILAGYPWFTDWGRDTMLAFTGLVLCTGRKEDAKEILESFSEYVENGLIPNVFPNTAKEKPAYNTMDASLWYFYAVERFLFYYPDAGSERFIQTKIYPKLKEIVKAYQKGTDYSIHMDTDGLISGGSDLDQITWMDVRVGSLVVTPRHGKPVEINALWYNALKVMELLSIKFQEDGTGYSELALKVKHSFEQKFWNEEKNCLYDVIEPFEDCVRPNQIWAVSLPYTMLEEEQQKQITDIVYQELYTPYGLRSLSPAAEGYRAEYIGKLIERDLSYHMGTTWAFPIGGFISSYCKVNHYKNESVQRAKEMCELFLDHMADGCLNGIAEIFDGDFPCTSRGCYTQAWSVGEVLRAYTEDVFPYLK